MRYSPHDLLPVDITKEHTRDFFYSEVAKHLIPDTIRIMHNGIALDMEKVNELSDVVNNVLRTVTDTLSKNTIMQQFRKQMYKGKLSVYTDVIIAKMRTYKYYYVEYKHKNMQHRTYVINHLIALYDLPTAVKDKWAIKDVKQLSKAIKHPQIEEMVKGGLQDTDLLECIMIRYANTKAELYNRKYVDQLSNIEITDVIGQDFNPASNKQIAELFGYLGLKSDKISKITGNESFSKDVVEGFLTVADENNKPLIEILTMLLDHSSSAIIRNNFIASFRRCSVDSILYGNLNLAGAKTFRYTSSNPNLLNTPSTGSVYAKPLKRCLVAKEGYVIYAVDYAALESRVIANLSKDENSLKVFTDGIDGHSLNTLGFGFKAIPELNKLFADIDDETKGKYFEVKDENGNITFEREFT